MNHRRWAAFRSSAVLPGLKTGMTISGAHTSSDTAEKAYSQHLIGSPLIRGGESAAGNTTRPRSGHHHVACLGTSVERSFFHSWVYTCSPGDPLPLGWGVGGKGQSLGTLAAEETDMS